MRKFRKVIGSLALVVLALIVMTTIIWWPLDSASALKSGLWGQTIWFIALALTWIAIHGGERIAAWFGRKHKAWADVNTPKTMTAEAAQALGEHRARISGSARLFIVWFCLYALIFAAMFAYDGMLNSHWPDARDAFWPLVIAIGVALLEMLAWRKAIVGRVGTPWKIATLSVSLWPSVPLLAKSYGVWDADTWYSFLVICFGPLMTIALVVPGIEWAAGWIKRGFEANVASPRGR